MDENRLFEAEVSPRQIIKFMRKNIYNNYSKENLQLVSNDYLSARSSLFSLMNKISNRMGFKSQTYFLSIYYLDILFLENKKIDCNYKILGLACLLLAAKFIENDPYVPNLSNFTKMYNAVVRYKYIISVTELFYAEVLVCKMLGYKLNYYTIYDFNSFFFGHGIIKIEQLSELKNNIYSNFTNRNFEIDSSNSIFIRKILEKIYRKSRFYLDLIMNNSHLSLKYNSLIMSIFIMKKSVEEILLEENKQEHLNKEKFFIDSSRYFEEIMRELYDINYESMDSYQELISDVDLMKLLKGEKIENVNSDVNDYDNNPALNNNNDNNTEDNNYNGKRKSIMSYTHKNKLISTQLNSFYNMLDNSLNENQFERKSDYLRHSNKLINYKDIDSQNSYKIASRSNKKYTSIPKKYHYISSYGDLNKTNEKNRVSIQKYNDPILNNELPRHSEIKSLKHVSKLQEYNEMQSRMNGTFNGFRKKHNQTISSENNDEIFKMIKKIENEEEENFNQKLIQKIDSPDSIENIKINNYGNHKKLAGLRKKLYTNNNNSLHQTFSEDY